MDSTESARPVNPDNTNPDSGQSLLSLVLACGGGYIPSRGTYSAKVWGKLLGISPAAVRRRMKEHRIPYRDFGDERYYAARDVLRRLPLVEQEE